MQREQIPGKVRATETGTETGGRLLFSVSSSDVLAASSCMSSSSSSLLSSSCNNVVCVERLSMLQPEHVRCFAWH